MNFDLAPMTLFLQTSFFGIKIWVLILALASLLTCLILAAALLCIFRRRRNSKRKLNPNLSSQHLISWGGGGGFAASSLDRRLLSQRIIPDIEMMETGNQLAEYSSNPLQDCAISISGDLESVSRLPQGNARKKRGGFVLSWSEIETATGGFADHNIVGDQDGAFVYLGLLNNARVAIIQLPPESSSRAEEFMAEMDVIGHIRHKNLVHLLGYCVEGDHRAIVMEYVENGNLHQWLHECPEEASPLSWDQRMNILQGVAKGLAYLHEGIEPKIIHGHLKSTSILLDRQWNAKISDLCISKLRGHESDRATLHSIGSSGDLAPEFVSTDMSDVYSFGVLVVEIICGRSPDLGGGLIEWLKSMIADGKTMSVADPKLPQMPSSIALKRMLLVGFRCVDPETSHRPTMGEVVHMLEPSELMPIRDGQIVQSVESLDNEEQRGSVSESSAREY